MPNNIFTPNRKSFIEIGKIYFWTATINNWQHLLLRDEYKDVIINSLEFLSDKGKINLYAFVIMPNHIHLIWKINELNGKETAQGSLLKFTAHTFKKMLSDPSKLNSYKIEAPNKQFEFWQRDSLAVHLFNKQTALQKLNYIHNNPLAEHWNLVTHPCDYYYSSAKFYERDEKNFSFLKDLWEEF